MIDALGNELYKNDLVIYAKPTGSNARLCLAIVVDPEKQSIFSMYTYSVDGELVKVYSTRPGVGVSSWKLFQFDPANDHTVHEIYDELKEKAKKYL